VLAGLQIGRLVPISDDNMRQDSVFENAAHFFLKVEGTARLSISSSKGKVNFQMSAVANDTRLQCRHFEEDAQVAEVGEDEVEVVVDVEGDEVEEDAAVSPNPPTSLREAA